MMRYTFMIALFFTPAVLTAAEIKANRIVYWGNIQTARAVRVFNTPDAERLAKAEVERIGGSGWILLENSTAVGYGAAFCKTNGGTTQFFVAHGYATGRDAVNEAKKKAGGGSALCNNALWRVSPPPDAREPNLVESTKALIRSTVVSPTEQCFRPTGAKEYRSMRDTDDPTKGDIKTCPRVDEGTNACVCVRG